MGTWTSGSSLKLNDIYMSIQILAYISELVLHSSRTTSKILLPPMDNTVKFCAVTLQLYETLWLSRQKQEWMSHKFSAWWLKNCNHQQLLSGLKLVGITALNQSRTKIQQLCKIFMTLIYFPITILWESNSMYYSDLASYSKTTSILHQLNKLNTIINWRLKKLASYFLRNTHSYLKLKLLLPESQVTKMPLIDYLSYHH